MRTVNLVCLIAGIMMCVIVWFAPFTRMGLPDFAVHMVRHMTLVAIAAPLLVLGAPQISQSLPSMPLLASFAEFVIVWAWHMPGLHDLAQAKGGWLILEQACFLLIGILLWSSVMDPERTLAGAGAALLTSMHMTLLGALIILSPRALYRHEGCVDLDQALEAQQLGGMIMLLIGTPIYLLAGLWRTREALAVDSSPPHTTDTRT